jgi:hypothetical protein
MKNILLAEDIYSAVWPLHFVSQISGLAPYSLKPRSECPSRGVIITYLCRIWSTIVMIFLLASKYISIRIIIAENYAARHSVVEILFSLSQYSYSIISVFLSLTINRYNVSRILKKLSQIDELFSEMNYRNQIYKNSRLFIILQLVVLISTLLAFLCFNLYQIHCDIGVNFTNDILFDILPVFLNSIATLQFVNSVLLLRNKYRYLNFKLESCTLTSCSVTRMNNGNAMRMTPVENYTLATKLSVSEPRYNCIPSRHQRLRNLRIIYSRLHDVCLLINITYGIPLLCATFWVFINIISAANYAIKLKHNDYLYLVETILWSGYCVALMIIIAVSCSLAVGECNRSPVIVQKILLSDDTDSEYSNDLDKMFTQFKVMKIGFSACGMFEVDLSFLCGIFGATLSYLIIFLQL